MAIHMIVTPITMARTYRHMGADTLTGRQFEVLCMVARGLADTAIAAELKPAVSEMTAKRHVRDILSKLGARNRANAVHIAHQKGLLR